MPEHRPGHLPAVQCVANLMTLHFDRKLINVLSVEIVPDVVVAGSVIAIKISRQWRQNSSGGKRQESAVRDRIHAAAEIIVNRPLKTACQALHGRQLKAVIVTVCAGGELHHVREPGIRGLKIRKRSETTLADSLITVCLRKVGHV